MTDQAAILHNEFISKYSDYWHIFQETMSLKLCNLKCFEVDTGQAGENHYQGRQNHAKIA